MTAGSYQTLVYPHWRKRRRSGWLGGLVAAVLAGSLVCVSAGEGCGQASSTPPVAAGSSEAAPTYWHDVRPILRKHCTVCHNERRLDDPAISAGIALDQPQRIRQAQRQGQAVVVPGQPERSLLYQSLVTTDVRKRMPLDADPLSAGEIAVIRRWIAAGLPEGSRPEPAAEASATAGSIRAVRALPVVLPTRASPPPVLKLSGTLELLVPIGPLPPVTAVAFSPDGQRLATGSYGRVTLWDLNTVRPVWMNTHVLGMVHDVKFSPDGQTLAVAGGQPSVRGEVRLLATDTGRLLRTLGGHRDAVAAVAFSPDGRLLASASFDKTVRLWELASGQVRHVFTGHSDFVYGVAFDPAGQWYATASKDRTGRLVRVDTGQSQLTFSGMNDEVLAVAVHPGGKLVVTSGLEPQLHWWDAQTAERKNRTAGPGQAVHEIAFDASGNLCVVAGGDGTLRLYNGSNGGLLRSTRVADVVFAVAVDAKGERVATGSSDGLVRLWQAADLRPLLILWSGRDDQWLALAPEGYWVAAESLGQRAQWQAGGRPLTDRQMLQPLWNSEALRQAARGGKVTPPTWK